MTGPSNVVPPQTDTKPRPGGSTLPPDHGDNKKPVPIDPNAPPPEDKDAWVKEPDLMSALNRLWKDQPASVAIIPAAGTVGGAVVGAIGAWGGGAGAVGLAAGLGIAVGGAAGVLVLAGAAAAMYAYYND